MPRLSCVIPVVGSTCGLESTLISVLEKRPDGCEVLVVLNTPYDDPYHLKDEIRFVESPGSNWVSCATLGIRVSRAPIVHLLSAGCEVAGGWADWALRHFVQPDIAAVAPVLLNSADERQVLAAGVRYRAGGRRTVSTALPAALGESIEILGPTLDAAFFRKSALELLSDGLPTMLGAVAADVDLALTMRWAGFRAILEPRCQIRAPQLLAPPSSGYEQGLIAERLFWRNARMSPRWLSLLTHPLVVAGELVASLARGTTLTQIAGRVRGFLSASDYRLHYQWLNILRETVAEERERMLVDRRPSGLRIDSAHAAMRTIPTPATVRVANS